MIRLFIWILALIMGGYGYLCIRSPEDAIYVANFWRFDNFEPSDTYIRWTRVAGVLFIIIAIALIVESFLLF